MLNNNEFEEIIPADSPKTEIAPISSAMGNPEDLATFLERASKVADRIMAARAAIIQKMTYPQDWVVFGAGDAAKACLSAAGAIRLAVNGNFPIVFEDDVEYTKEEFVDEIGKGYRYTYSGHAKMGQMRVHAVGAYSTRDLLLGKTKEGFRDIKDINEAYIQKAAHTYFKSNAIKDLLGLKGLPASEYTRICGQIGKDASKTHHQTFDKGNKGGKTADAEASSETKKKLQAAISDLAKNGLMVCLDETGECVIGDAPDLMDGVDICKNSLKNLTTFDGKDGPVWCDSLDKLAEKPGWLGKTYGKIKKLRGEE